MPKVMVVDDADLARQTLIRLLRREGFDTVEATNGREALDGIGLHAPDLILLDVQMPELDGLELLEILHSHPQWKAVPVVMLTGVSDTHAIRRAERLGAKEYLVKTTFSLGQMLAAVKRYTAYRPA